MTAETLEGSTADGFRWRARVLRAGELALIAFAYFALAKASLAFASINPSATPIWPPTGLALGLILLRGQRILPAIFLGALAANFLTAGTLATSSAIALGNTLEAFVGAFLVGRWAGGRAAFRTPSGIGKFALIVAAASTPISATLGVTALSAGGHAAWANFPGIWATWWLGDVAGAVMVAPPIVLWADSLRSPRAAGNSTLETALVLGFAALVGALALGPLLLPGPVPRALAFLAVIPLLWAALRRNQQETAAVALILSGFAVWGVADGAGPFIQESLNASFLLLVSFIASITLPSLALSAAVASRDLALMRSAEDYRRLVEGVRDHAIFMLDPKGRVASWNSGAVRITQFPAEEILGRHVSLFSTAEDRAADKPENALACAAQAGTYQDEGWRLRRDGSRFWASVAISAIRSEQGELAGFAKIVRDTTQMRDAQTALEQTRERLVQAQKLEAIGQLTGGVAHDFNNLLMVISAGVRALTRHPEPAKQEKILDEMRHSVERGAGLTRQLLAFARREPLAPEVVDVARQVAAIRELLERSLRADIRVELQFPSGLWSIEVDSGQLDLAILNLAVNARDAMPEGGVLRIAAENAPARGAQSGDFVKVSVTDNGAGMAPEVRARAFEPFYSTKGPGKGTGLGLSLVYAFAVQSGGSAEIESGAGRGTTVTLRLPRAHRAAAPRAASPPAEHPAAIGSALVVEDDDGVARVVCEMIEQLGYRATRAASAAAALRALEQGSAFDIVFSDIVMPGGMNGAELATEIRRRWPNLPIVLTTGYSADAQTAGARFRVLRKPYEPKDLGEAFAAARAGADPTQRAS